MPAFPSSPLFTAASAAIQAAARRELASTQFGQLMTQVGRLTKQARPGGSTARLVRDMVRTGGINAPSALRKLQGGNLGEIINQVQRYSRSGPRFAQEAIGEFLESLGPAGKLIKALAAPKSGSSGNRDMSAIINYLRALGGEALPPHDWQNPADIERALAAARAMIERERAMGRRAGITPVAGGTSGAPLKPEHGRETIDVPRSFQSGTFRVRADHPMVTGDMVPTPNSSNVYEFGYDIDEAFLYVRYQQPHKSGSRGTAGSLYRYGNIPPEQFMQLYKVRNAGHLSDELPRGQDQWGGDSTPGTWIWTHIRERGTVAGHKTSWELVGIMPTTEHPGGYVPRQATVKAQYRTTHLRTGAPLKHPKKTGSEEYFETRQVRTLGGKFMKSQKLPGYARSRRGLTG